MTILGVDIGSKTIGIAVSDDTESMAVPLESIERNMFPQKIKIIIKNYNITEIAAGLPLSLNHENVNGFAVVKTKENAAFLFEGIDLPIHYQDERFTSISAFKALTYDTHKPVGNKRKSINKIKKQLKNIDAISATYILQSYLDLKNQSSTLPTQ